jgi:uncharacterized protein (DUF433 family)
MVVQIRNHIELETDNPLDARISGRGFKAYLVANLAFNDGVEASAEHYELSLADVHAAMAFYYDNQEAIKAAIAEARELGYKMGARDSSEVIAEIKERMKNKGD